MAKNFTLYSLGKRIAYLRQKKGLTQLEFSADSGIAKSYVCELEAGKRNPSMLVLEKVALALNVTLSELLEGVGPIAMTSTKR